MNEPLRALVCETGRARVSVTGLLPTHTGTHGQGHRSEGHQCERDALQTWVHDASLDSGLCRRRISASRSERDRRPSTCFGRLESLPWPNPMRCAPLERWPTGPRPGSFQVSARTHHCRARPRGHRPIRRGGSASRTSIRPGSTAYAEGSVTAGGQAARIALTMIHATPMAMSTSPMLNTLAIGSHGGSAKTSVRKPRRGCSRKALLE